MHLVGARDVLVGRRQHLAMGVLEQVEPLLETVHQHAAEIDDVAPLGAAIGLQQRAHQLLILQDQVRIPRICSRIPPAGVADSVTVSVIVMAVSPLSNPQTIF